MTDDAGCELHPSELAIKSICPPVVFGAQVYKVLVDSPTDLKGDVECRLVVTHRSGCRWIVRRRFSDLLCLYEFLVASFDVVPPLDTSLMSNRTKTSTSRFLGESCLKLQDFVDRILARENLARHPALQFILGVVRPEPPAGLRVVACGEEHEMEIRPGDVNLIAGCTRADAHGAPVDGYFVEVMHLETGASNQFTRDVGCRGSQLVRAPIGKFKPGPHRLIVRALNLVGPSPPIEVTIDPSKVTRLIAPLSSSGAADSPSKSLDCTRKMCQPTDGPCARKLGSTCNNTTVVVESTPVRACCVAEPIRQLLRPVVSLPALASQSTSTAGLFTQRLSAPIGPVTGDHHVDFAGHADNRFQKPVKDCQRLSHEDVPARLEAASEPSYGIQEPLLEKGSKGVAGTTVAGKDDACVICLSEEKTHAFVPCGHRCVCRTCGKALMLRPPRLLACPMCRAVAVSVIHIYS